ncbi:MAG: rhodanese-like domain-containing protein [Lachnospiraceae bacterium]|nr:rhodanese-like domain-containing protein [Lachnospiraceae bacterium]
MFQTISMRQLEAILEQGGMFTLLDVRPEEQFLEGHLEGAKNLPLALFVDDAVCVCIPRDRPVIVYCAYGGQSMLAAKYLSSMGYEVLNTSGGLHSYRGTHFVRETI